MKRRVRKGGWIKKSENVLTFPSNRLSTYFRFTSVAVFDWTDQVDIKFLLKD